ncbi:MAG: polysaccharide biosynthesis C-terminal domain-containing protein [Myxococcales bacterium]|nr:polysaccharide biosynthesis C-terminal domain-containing protein [Myxococcales bacterium]
MHEQHLVRGAFVNLLGVIAKLIHPLFFIFIIRMFGTELVGVYFVATFLVQVAVGAVTAGYNQGTILFASPHVQSGSEGELYRVLANGFVITLGLSLALLGLGHVAAEPLVARFYSDRPELLGALQILLLSLPFTAFTQVAIAATKAHMRMEYDALINGLIKPFALLGFALVAYLLELGLPGLMWALVASQALLAVMALWGFRRHYSLRRTLAACFALRFERELLSFAIPQSLNMTFNRYVTRLDVIMLAAFGHSNHEVAFYSAAALITSSLREIKLAFGSALAPIAARYHAARQREELEEAFGRVSRWTTTIVAPLILLVLVLRDDVLRLIDGGFVGDTRFMALLLVPPFLSCAVGLAGNLIVYTRHSRWNLANSVMVAGLNTGLNLLLIPSHGLLGAAAATVTASAVISAVQLVELYGLERVRLRVGAIVKPHLGLVAMLVAAAALWDPAALQPLAARIGFGLALVVGFALLMLLLRHEEAVRVLSRLRGGAPAVDNVPGPG